MPATNQLKQTDPVTGTLSKSIARFTIEELRSSPHKVREACLRNGFFLIDPDESEITDTAVAQAEAFFSIDDNDPRKQRVKRGDTDFGWMPTYSEPAYQPGTVSRLESFDCGISNVRRSNDSDPWPDTPGFRESICDCWEHVSALGNTALSALSEAAELGPDFLPLA